MMGPGSGAFIIPHFAFIISKHFIISHLLFNVLAPEHF